MDAKKSLKKTTVQTIVKIVDATECPFREFKDSELVVDFWGLNPSQLRSIQTMGHNKTSTVKAHSDSLWIDDHTQPLPRSVRHYLNGWIRAEDLAENRWDAEVVIFEDTHNTNKMSTGDFQLSHAQVLYRSSFCRNVMSICYALERTSNLMVEHQWENFSFSFGPEGWRAKYHIYSPGMKSGGGAQHRPLLSKNGCYLVRLFYLGAWRCVWVNDLVPVDATDSPLLPFSPITTVTPPKGPKQNPVFMISSYVHLWPLLICKALLKLAAPDMNADDEEDDIDDEPMDEFDILHALTGGLVVQFPLNPKSAPLSLDGMWDLFASDVPIFNYDDEDDNTKSKISKGKKETVSMRNKDKPLQKSSTAVIKMVDTKDVQVFELPGITPAHEMFLLVTMIRDLPLRKPLPEPEVPLWKTYRWVDWAKRHGLYENYECPRTKFIKSCGLMKLSYAPHLIDVQSTESLNVPREDEKQGKKSAKEGRDKDTDKFLTTSMIQLAALREQLREWVLYEAIHEYISAIKIAYYPSVYEFASCADAPPVRPINPKFVTGLKQTDVQAPKQAPVYLQLDSPEPIRLKISLSSIHPRVFLNCGVPIEDYLEPSYVFLEEFKWFEGCDLPTAKGFIETRGYDSMEVIFSPGRYFCRLWIHASVHWYLMLLSEAKIVIGNRDAIQAAAAKECPWVYKYLMNIYTNYLFWAKNRSQINVLNLDKEFYRSYLPDLYWDEEKVGYKKCFVHWMFRQALQSLLKKRLAEHEFQEVCVVFRRYFCDPYFGITKGKPASIDIHALVEQEPCDCEPEFNEIEGYEETLSDEVKAVEEKSLINNSMLLKLIENAHEQQGLAICDLATSDVSCNILKADLRKYLKIHDAAVIIQSYWRGYWARKCLFQRTNFTIEVQKLVLDNAFGHVDTLTALMNEFFSMYPGTKDAYSIAYALGGIYSFNQYSGVAQVSTKCKWIPYFQDVFTCHAPTDVHFDMHSTTTYNTFAVFNNDNKEQLPQTFNAHTTFQIEPNETGYTVIGHGTLHKTLDYSTDVHWQLSVMCSTLNTFHICDKFIRETENLETPVESLAETGNLCKEIPISPAVKIRVDEIFIPNRRNILGAFQIACFKHDAICFRAEATNNTLEMEATLKTINPLGEVVEISKCSGVGELYWPFIRLQPHPLALSPKRRKSVSQIILTTPKDTQSGRATKKSLAKPSSAGKARSTIKMHIKPMEPKNYIIEVTAPNGWALTQSQWERVNVVRNDIEPIKFEPPTVRQKSATAEKARAAALKEKKDKETDFSNVLKHQEPQPGDAYVELECSITAGGGLSAKRDDERDLAFFNAMISWDSKQPGRNAQGYLYRQMFRDENLPAPVETTDTRSALFETELANIDFEDELRGEQTLLVPTPVSESVSEKASEQSQETVTYLTLPDALKDKFLPLDFLEECTKERFQDEPIFITNEMAEAAKNERHYRIEAAIDRMKELQIFNEAHVLGRQKKRIYLLERIQIDSSLGTDIAESFDERDFAVSEDVLARQISANRKKEVVKNKK